MFFFLFLTANTSAIFVYTLKLSEKTRCFQTSKKSNSYSTTVSICSGVAWLWIWCKKEQSSSYSSKKDRLLLLLLSTERLEVCVEWVDNKINMQRQVKSLNVAYWSLTRLSCQNRKCTSVNNRCILLKISGDQGRPWLSRGWIECKIVTLAGSRWASNCYITPATGSSGQLERRCWNEKDAGPPGPRLSSPGEWERKAVIARREGVNMLQFCSVFNSPLTQ